MWVDPAVRGLGVGRRLLAELEGARCERSSPVVRLETNGSLTEAIAHVPLGRLHARSSAFNDEPYADHWFEKRLGRPPA